jgi:plasmid stability protein
MALVQVRNVPDETVDKLKARAGEQGITLAAYVRELLQRDANSPTNAEVLARIDRDRPRRGPSNAEIVAEIRRVRESS